MVKIEVLCESVQDCIIAQACGANRIELNNGVMLGGLTPSLGTFLQAKKHVSLPIVVMIRPRTAGFDYHENEYRIMLEDLKIFLEHGADGIVFGFLNQDRSINIDRTQAFVHLIHSYNKEAIFHRAFDNVTDPYIAIESLISCGVDRILTSGLEETAVEGLKLIHNLQSKYGDQIEILPGSGITSLNIAKIISESNVNQVHGSFKEWYADKTSLRTNQTRTHDNDYYGVSENELKKVIQEIEKLNDNGKGR